MKKQHSKLKKSRSLVASEPQLWLKGVKFGRYEQNIYILHTLDGACFYL